MLKTIFEHQPTPQESDDFAENFFFEKFKRSETGEFEVPSIFDGINRLGDSYNACFVRNRRVFERLSAEQLKLFLSIIKEYEQKGIISICKDYKSGKYYAPIVLVNTNKKSIPLRICLDTSQKFFATV